MGIRSQLLAQVHSCSFFLQINSGAKAVPSLLFSWSTAAVSSQRAWGHHPYGMQGGSGGIAKLISAGSNMITAKVRARLGKCVSTLLSLYLSPCHSIPAAWPAAAPAAYANSWWSAAAGAVGTLLAGAGTSPFPPSSYFLRSPLLLWSSSKLHGPSCKRPCCSGRCSLPAGSQSLPAGCQSLPAGPHQAPSRPAAPQNSVCHHSRGFWHARRQGAQAAGYRLLQGMRRHLRMHL